MFGINLCKLYFASVTSLTVIFGTLLNNFEPYIPVIISNSIRYGKFASKEKLKLAEKIEVPKSYFRHFYFTAAVIYCPLVLREVFNVYIFGGQVSQWFKNLLDFSYGYERTTSVPATRVFLAVILIALQIFRRFYDTHFVSVFSKKATINLAHYIIGMTYYPAVILIVLSEAPKFVDKAISNENLNLREIGIVEIFAVILFLWAWYHQHVTTVILANLRKNKKGDVVTQDYQLPQDDWFTYLSSPHCTAEIIMYSALTMLLSDNTGWWYVYAWVITNQAETIFLSHQWYQSNFKNFPKNRKALIPFVY